MNRPQYEIENLGPTLETTDFPADAQLMQWIVWRNCGEGWAQVFMAPTELACQEWIDREESHPIEWY